MSAVSLTRFGVLTRLSNRRRVSWLRMARRRTLREVERGGFVLLARERLVPYLSGYATVTVLL